MAKPNLIMLSTLCTLLGVSAASARADAGEHFGKLDRNGDGALSVQEFESHALGRFAKADFDHDGKLSAEERSAQYEGHHRERFARDDLNHDGVLDRSEVERMPRAIFVKIDTDKSGGLTPKELTAFAKAKQKEDGLPMDTDGDGALSQSEAQALARAKFAELDADRDRRLSREELETGEHGEHGWCALGESEG